MKMLCHCFAILLVLAASTVFAVAAAAPQPNVLFIVAGDFRAELASDGSPAHTLNLDPCAVTVLFAEKCR